MRKYFFLILSLTVLFIACSTVDMKEKRQEIFKSSMTTQEFFIYTPDALKRHGFTIISSNEGDGSLRASKTVDDNLRIDFIFYYDYEKRDVYVTTINRIKNPEGEVTEYYTLDDYNSDYKEYFYPTLNTLKTNISKKDTKM